MIDTDHTQRQVVRTRGQVDGSGRLSESRVDVVDGNRIMGIGGIAGDITDDRKFAVGRGERVQGDERRNFCRKIDAVDEDVRLYYFLVRTRLGGCFGEVPFLCRRLLALSCNVRWLVEWLQLTKISSSPALVQRSTAPLPQRPNAPITSTRGKRPDFALPLSTASLTSLIKASSLS